MPDTVYLIHFDKKHYHAQHYIGYTNNLDERINSHRKGQGSRLLDVINNEKIHWDVARTWEGDRKLERKLKNQKKARRLCPVCIKNEKTNRILN